MTVFLCARSELTPFTRLRALTLCQDPSREPDPLNGALLPVSLERLTVRFSDPGRDPDDAMASVLVPRLSALGCLRNLRRLTLVGHRSWPVTRWWARDDGVWKFAEVPPSLEVRDVALAALLQCAWLGSSR